MAVFPAQLKPLLNQGYGFGGSSNLFEDKTSGAKVNQALDYKYGPVNFQINLSLTPINYNIFQDFYINTIQSGASKFEMNLDSGLGVETNNVQIVKDSLSIDGSSMPIVRVSFNVQAERTAAQDAPFDGNLVDLYDVYGEGLKYFLDELEIFVLEVLP
jgi:hypothetical protein